MSSYETILFETADGVATITLNRPDAFNALNVTLLAELREAFRRVAGEERLRAVVLTGAGRAFCSGQDLRDLQQEGATDPGAAVRDALDHRYSPLIKAMRTLPKPIVGAINGVAAGAGMSLAMATDIRLVSDRASFTLAFSRVGLIPDAGSNYFLPHLVGLPRALELAWTSRRVSAEEAVSIGLANHVVPADELLEDAAELARGLARGPAQAIALTKQAMTRGAEASLGEVLDLEAELQSRLVGSADFVEGVSAFLEKREPEFGGPAGTAQAQGPGLDTEPVAPGAAVAGDGTGGEAALAPKPADPSV
jgi:2-(1,2-epoxy-1,2-dihydrophenyl)acetyl-CoA isomerase